LIVFGAFIAGARDLSFDAYGYAIVFLSNITTAIYLATIARVGCIITSLSLSHTHTHKKKKTIKNLKSFPGIIGLLFLNPKYFFFSGKTSGLNSFGLMWCNGKPTDCVNRAQ
jgi:hypothetical protein